MRSASLPPLPSLLPPRDGDALRFGSARGRLPAPRHIRSAADGTLAWCLCNLSPERASLVAWRPREATIAWRFALAGSNARFAVSPDGALLILYDHHGHRRLLDARHGVTLAETRDGGGLPDALALARADVRRALIVRGTHARVIDLDTGATVASLVGAAPAALSPDGHHVALTSARAVVVHALGDGPSLRLPVPRGARATVIDLADTLSVGFDDGSVRVRVAARHLVTIPPPAVGGPVVSLRNGRHGVLAVGHAEGLVRWLGDDGGVREAVGDGPVEDIAADLSRAFFREASGAPALDLVDRSRHDLRDGHLDAVTAIGISRDVVVTASRDGSIRVWDPDSRETRITLEGHQGPIVALALTPDGRGAFTLGAHDGLRAWHFASGTERPRPAVAASLVGATHLIVSPCGDRLAALTETDAVLLDARTGLLLGRAQLGPWGPVAAFDDRGEVLYVPRAWSSTGIVVTRLDARDGANLTEVTLPFPAREARRAKPCVTARGCHGTIVTAETDRAAMTRWVLGEVPEGARETTGVDLLRLPLVAWGGRVLAGASGTRIEVCALDDGRRGTFHLPERHDTVTSLAVEPEGRWVVAGTAQGLAQRFDL